MPFLILALKKYSIRKGYGWFAESELSRVKELVKAMEFLDDIPSEQKEALTVSVLLLLEKKIPVMKDRTLFFTLLWMGHDGLLRVDELLRLHCVHDVVWNSSRTGFQLRVFRFKTHRKALRS